MYKGMLCGEHWVHDKAGDICLQQLNNSPKNGKLFIIALIAEEWKLIKPIHNNHVVVQKILLTSLLK